MQVAFQRYLVSSGTNIICKFVNKSFVFVCISAYFRIQMSTSNSNSISKHLSQQLFVYFSFTCVILDEFQQYVKCQVKIFIKLEKPLMQNQSVAFSASLLETYITTYALGELIYQNTCIWLLMFILTVICLQLSNIIIHKIIFIKRYAQYGFQLT